MKSSIPINIDEALPAGACPSDPPGRIAGHDRVLRHIAGHDRAGTDHPERTDIAPRDDDRAGTDRGAAVDSDRAHLPVVRTRQSSPDALSARGWRSLVRIAPGPMNTPSPIVTP